MQKENTDTCLKKFYNFFLIVHLKLCGHEIQKIIKSTGEDRKSYFYFLPSEKLEKDKEDFFNDIPVLVPLRTFEKTYKDIKFMANSPNLFKS